MSSSSAGQIDPSDPGPDSSLPPPHVSMAVAAAPAAAEADAAPAQLSQPAAESNSRPEPEIATSAAATASSATAAPGSNVEPQPSTPTKSVQAVASQPPPTQNQISFSAPAHIAQHDDSHVSSTQTQRQSENPVTDPSSNTADLPTAPLQEPNSLQQQETSTTQQQTPTQTLAPSPHILSNTGGHIDQSASQSHSEIQTNGSEGPAVKAEPQHQPNMDMDVDMDWGNFPQAPSTPMGAYPAGLDMHQAARMLRLMNPSNLPLSSPQHTTVTPSQVTLPPPVPDHEMFDASAHMGGEGTVPHNPHLESFARIEFQDSVFQMTTYEVVIGRDQKALAQARRDERRMQNYQREIQGLAGTGVRPPSPPVLDRKFSKSYVSEEGGMLGPESDSGNEGRARPAKRRKTSAGESSQVQREETSDNVISNRQYVSHTPGAAAVDLAALRPSPNHVPFIGIHSPGPNIAEKTKAISREHLRIAFNKKTGVFEATSIHTNGFFCEDIHYRNDTVVLHSGDRLQIKDVDFTFIINGVPKGRTGAETLRDEKAPARSHSQSGKEMSFDFEQSYDNSQMQDTSDSENELSPPPLSDEEDIADDEVDENEDEDNDEANDEVDKTEAEDTMQQLVTADGEIMMPQIPKKRGPGRPPKNGIMSKREQRLLKKQQQELAKKTLPQAPPMEPPIKRKVGRPRKHPLPENAGDQPEKRKYKPRKPKNEDGEEGSDAERKAKDKKDKKVRPKSPPLHLNREDYTLEDLQKPPKNYSMLIDEALTAHPEGLTLKQVYKRICERYPHFYFNVETKGWESSVRHNLIGNKAFHKDEERGVWMRLPGIDLDSSKKTRKGTPPDRELAGQGYGAYNYPYNNQHMPPAVPGYPPGQIPPNYQMPNYNGQQPQQQQQQQSGQPVQPYVPRPASGPQPAPAAGAQQPAQAHAANFALPPAPPRPQVGTAQPNAYSSPYASRPPPPAGTIIKTEEGAAAVPPSANSQQPGVAPKPVYHTPGTQPNPATAGAAQQPPPQHHPHPQVPQQATPQPGRASAGSPPAAPPKPPIDPVLLHAVVNLKNGLITNLKKAHNPHADTIVYSALNRCAGLKKEATDQNDNMERICMKGIQQVIDGFRSKHRSPTPGSTVPGSESALLEPSVVRTLVGFKDVSCNTLKGNLGPAQAEAITLSAIDRVLGLADDSLVNDDKLANLEQNLMNTAKQLLQTLNQTLTQRRQSTEAPK